MAAPTDEIRERVRERYAAAGPSRSYVRRTAPGVWMAKEVAVTWMVS